MKAGIHPEYMQSKITCACGRVTETYATRPEIHVEICSHCHPFFTGRQKLVDTAGRVERFRRKYADAPAGDAGEAPGEAATGGDAEDAPEPVAAAAAEATDGDDADETSG